MIESITLTG